MLLGQLTGVQRLYIPLHTIQQTLGWFSGKWKQKYVSWNFYWSVFSLSNSQLSVDIHNNLPTYYSTYHPFIHRLHLISVMRPTTPDLMTASSMRRTLRLGGFRTGLTGRLTKMECLCYVVLLQTPCKSLFCHHPILCARTLKSPSVPTPLVGSKSLSFMG